MVPTRKKKGQNEWQFSRLDETLIDFVIGNGTTVNAMGNEALESETNGRHEDFERIVESASQNQVIGLLTTESEMRLTAPFLLSKIARTTQFSHQ